MRKSYIFRYGYAKFALFTPKKFYNVVLRANSGANYIKLCCAVRLSGATTLSIMTLRMATLSKITFGIMTVLIIIIKMRHLA